MVFSPLQGGMDDPFTDPKLILHAAPVLTLDFREPRYVSDPDPGALRAISIGFLSSRGIQKKCRLSLFPFQEGIQKVPPIPLGRDTLFRHGAATNFRRASWLKTTASGTPARAPEKIGPGRLLGFKRQRVELEQSDARETDKPDPTADPSLNYELGACELRRDP